jgi:hypothetical protein
MGAIQKPWSYSFFDNTPASVPDGSRERSVQLSPECFNLGR